MDWEERVLPSIGNEVVKAVVAQYNAEQLLTQREKVSWPPGSEVVLRHIITNLDICSLYTEVAG